MSLLLRRFFSVVGKVSLDQVKQANHNGEAWVTSINTNSKKAEEEDPRIKNVRIKGANAHKSHSDPNDPELVISLQYLDANEQKVRSEHVHEDGTVAPKP